MSIEMASVRVFCLVGVGLGAVYIAFFGSHRMVRERFEETTLSFRLEKGLRPDELEQGQTGGALLRWALAQMPEPKNEQAASKLSQALVRAGFARANAGRVLRLIRMGATASAAALAIIVGCLLHYSGAKLMALVACGAMFGAALPGYYLSKRARGRQLRIARQLSDVLDLLVVCVEAGLGLFEAVKIVGEETAHQGQDIGQELSLVSGEVSAGIGLGEALRNLAERTAVEDMKPLAATLIQSEQLGAQLGPTLRSSSDMLRSKRRLRAEEAAQKTTIKILFPLVLFILPPMLIVILAPALIQAIRTFSS
jgi:tight adherence protein C